MGLNIWGQALSRIDEATKRLEQAVARLEASTQNLFGRPNVPARPTGAVESEADVADRLDAVISRLDRVLEG
jgi:hypothetical protein